MPPTNMKQIELTSKLVVALIAVTVVSGMTASASAAKNPAYTDLTSASVVDVTDPDEKVQSQHNNSWQPTTVNRLIYQKQEGIWLWLDWGPSDNW